MAVTFPPWGTQVRLRAFASFDGSRSFDPVSQGALRGVVAVWRDVALDDESQNLDLIRFDSNGGSRPPGFLESGTL